jgi:uncharacterized metal-binding protein YceD (DUF177 family)
MAGKNEYIIPIKGLKEGKHRFEFDLKTGSIHGIENEMDVKLDLEIDKKSTFYHFYFNLSGKIAVECDNCLNNYDEEIKAHHEIIIKHSTEEGSFDEGEIEVKFISLEETQLDIASEIYEYLLINLPLKKICKNGKCDPEVLKILNADPLEKKNKEVDPRWDALKGLKEELNK